MAKVECAKVYVPRVAKEEVLCPDGYRSAKCITIETCYEGFASGTLEEFVEFLRKKDVAQTRLVNDLKQRVEIAETKVKTFEGMLKTAMSVMNKSKYAG
jgi:hypothetical protein